MYRKSEGKCAERCWSFASKHADLKYKSKATTDYCSTRMLLSRLPEADFAVTIQV